VSPAFRFPDGFLWGTVTAAHQVEGNNWLNDWWAWEQAGRVKESSGLAADQYNRFESDLEIARSLGHNAYRFSIEWSRIEPTPGFYSEEAITHYAQLIDACRRRGLEPIVTLHHFTNPLWFAVQGGWTSPACVDSFVRYVGMVSHRLGEKIRWWVTINEPTVLVFYGYLDGRWPPGEKSFPKAIRALENLIRAHQGAYAVIHAQAKERGQAAPRVGLAHHLRCYDPCRRWSLGDRVSVFFREHLANRWVLKACRDRMNFIGVNYYTRDFLHGPGWNPMGFLGTPCENPKHHPEAGPRSGMGWEIYPEGLRRVLTALKEYRKPILICENGIWTPDDNLRWDFIRRHVEQMASAMKEGVEVAGYLYWSLIDNFEWADGFAPRFGLVEVDYATQARRIRPSAHRYADLIRSLSS